MIILHLSSVSPDNTSKSLSLPSLIVVSIIMCDSTGDKIKRHKIYVSAPQYCGCNCLESGCICLEAGLQSSGGGAAQQYSRLQHCNCLEAGLQSSGGGAAQQYSSNSRLLIGIKV